MKKDRERERARSSIWIKRDRSALVEKREKKLSDGDTLYLDVRKENKQFFLFSKTIKRNRLCNCLIKSTGTEIVRYDDIGHSVTKEKQQLNPSELSTRNLLQDELNVLSICGTG